MLLEEVIVEDDMFSGKLINSINKEKARKDFNNKDCAELLMGRCNLSQRSYKNLKNLLKRQNVFLVDYTNAREFVNNLDVGKFNKEHTKKCDVEDCMFVSSSILETLKLVFAAEDLYERMEFVTPSQQSTLFTFLCTTDRDLYGNLDIDARTIFLRQTGDNFRASKSYPTEQISFNIMNITDQLNSPYGQFINCLFRGSESRNNLSSHCGDIFSEIDLLVRKGVELQIPNGTNEKFNVVVFFVADLGFVKEICGKCTSTGKYGCYRCKKKISDWHAMKNIGGKPQTVAEFVVLGNTALNKLGPNPDRTVPKFTSFQQNHFGQWVSILCVLLFSEILKQQDYCQLEQLSIFRSSF